MAWALTVAAIIERQGRFLFVEERDGGPVVVNQPAGHVEPGESLRDAVVREVLEETGLPFTPESLVGIYQLRAENGKDYCRVCFAGRVADGLEPAPRDGEILGCVWLTREELLVRTQRSALVLACLDDWLKGQRLPVAAASMHVLERPS